MMYGNPRRDSDQYDKYQASKRLDSCGQCIKYLLFVINLVFFLVACAIIGLGVYFLIDKSYIATVFGSVVATAAVWLLLLGGGLVFFLSFFGLMGAICEQRAVIIIYMSALVLIFAMCLTGFILGIVFRTQIDDHVRGDMRFRLQEDYGVDLDNKYNNGITVAWDKIQEQLKCCAVEDQSWKDYHSSRWFKKQPGEPGRDKPFVPVSCCKKDKRGAYIDRNRCQTSDDGPPGSPSGISNDALYYRGCYEAGKQFIADVSGYIIGLGVGMAFLLLLGVFLSFALLRYL